MKHTYTELFKQFPQGAKHFSGWCFNQFKVSMAMYDDSISEHRYIIAARYFGYPVKPPKYALEAQMEDIIYKMFMDYEAALVKDKADPMDELCNLDWQSRNSMNEELFKRQTKPSIRETLIPLTNFIRPGLIDTLVPFKARSSDIGLEIKPTGIIAGSPMTQEWIDSIQWSWDVKEGKIQIPF